MNFKTRFPKFRLSNPNKFWFQISKIFKRQFFHQDKKFTFITHVTYLQKTTNQLTLKLYK